VKSTVEQTKLTANCRSVAAELVAVRGCGGRGCEGGEIVIRGGEAEVAEVQDGAGEQGGMGRRAPTFAATTRWCWVGRATRLPPEEEVEVVEAARWEDERRRWR
jgi:hypothetical protein